MPTESDQKASRVLTTSYSELDEAMHYVTTHASQQLCILSRAWDYPLLERKTFYEALAAFLTADRRASCRIIVQDAYLAERRGENLKRLLRQFGEQIQVNQPGRQMGGIPDNFILADRQHLVRQLHYSQPRTVTILNDSLSVKPYDNAFETLWDSSLVAIHATVLGL